MAFVSLYRMGDVLALNLSKPMILGLGYTLTEIGCADGVGRAGGQHARRRAGRLAWRRGGGWPGRWRSARCSPRSAISASSGSRTSRVDQTLLYLATAADQFGNGMAGAVFVVYLSMLVNPRFPGAQYAFLSGFAFLLPRLLSRGGRYDGQQLDAAGYRASTCSSCRPGALSLAAIAVPAARRAQPQPRPDDRSMIDEAFAPAAAAVASGRIPGATLGVVDGGRAALGHASPAWPRWCPSPSR